MLMSMTWAFCFFFNDTATTEIYTSSHTLSLHDALPIWSSRSTPAKMRSSWPCTAARTTRSEEHTSELQSRELISYAVFCLKKKQRLALRHCLQQRPRQSNEARSSAHQPSLCKALHLPRRVPAATWSAFLFITYTCGCQISKSSHTLSLHDALPI